MDLSNIPLVILAGGKGTRITEYSKTIPKPMIKIGNKPIIKHIIDYYEYYGVNKFIIASVDEVEIKSNVGHVGKKRYLPN